jgi:VRR-NUC domain-containing protein
VPNETYTTSWSQKAKNKALGVSAGVPDLFVALPGRGLLGIEMKRIANYKVSPAQAQWIELLTTIPGVEARVCRGADEAIAFVSEVLDGVQSKA